MKIPNKQELPKTVFDHLSDIYFKYFTSCTAKPYSFWWLMLLLQQIILQIWEIIFEKNIKTNHVVDDKVIDEKLQYHFKREVAKRSASWS